jgi:hypothetical protein
MKGNVMSLKKLQRGIYIIMNSFFTIAFIYICTVNVSFAKEVEIEVEGSLYEFGEESLYEFSAESMSTRTEAEINTLGSFSLYGDIQEKLGQSDQLQYNIHSGNLRLYYNYDISSFPTDETEWHLVEDNSKEINGISLEDKIKKGALVVQSSLDGITWLEDVVLTDIFSDEGDIDEVIYTTNNIQQQNGCYYRLIVVYSLERKVGEGKFLFMKTDDIEKKKVAEVYDFFIVDDEIEEATSAVITPKKELGKKVNAGKDTGYFESNVVDLEDPHYGWDIGTFFVNGYTREVIQEDGSSVFLKNIGDKVTLWFNLVQNLDALNGDESLIIYEDSNGYDKEFEIEQTDFGRGTLIISYTDYQGEVHDPVIYTNYLAANTRTGVDSRVQLFEEGDYEVALDYEIEDSPRKIGSVSVLPSYTNYKIRFSFSIRNGNTMVYPFDIDTGAELSEKAITENGFRLDMAKSRYLTIDVMKSVLKESDDGSIVEDIRFNRPAKDGEIYTDGGIYTFTVKNLYTGGEPTTKTIFIGENKYMRAISTSGSTLVELNEKVALGATIAEDGTIIEPIEETVEVMEINAKTDISVAESENKGSQNDKMANAEIEEKANEDPDKPGSMIFVVGGLVIFLILSGVVLRRRK